MKELPTVKLILTESASFIENNTNENENFIDANVKIFGYKEYHL